MIFDRMLPFHKEKTSTFLTYTGHALAFCQGLHDLNSFLYSCFPKRLEGETTHLESWLAVTLCHTDCVRGLPFQSLGIAALRSRPSYEGLDKKLCHAWNNSQNNNVTCKSVFVGGLEEMQFGEVCFYLFIDIYIIIFYSLSCNYLTKTKACSCRQSWRYNLLLTFR